MLTTNANFWFGETSDQHGSAPNDDLLSIGVRLPVLVTEYVAVSPSPVRLDTCDITSWLALSKTKPNGNGVVEATSLAGPATPLAPTANVSISAA